jgi:phosphatidylinositol glycan class B
VTGPGAPEGRGDRRAAWIALGAVAAAALALRVGVALRLPNVNYPDEIHQYLEQAHRLVFGRGIVPWEWRDGFRSWILPGLLAGAMEAGRPFGGLGPLRAAQLLLSVLSLAPVVVAFATARRLRGLLAAVVAGACVASWFELAFFGPKALTEVVSAHALVLGLWLDAEAEEGSRRRIAAGALLGLAVALRPQVAPGALVAVAFSAGPDWRRWRPLAIGGGAVVAAAGLLDLAAWGRPFASWITMVRIAVVEGRAHVYGVAPWSAYPEGILATWGWAAALVLPLAALGARRRPAFAACALGVLATHLAFDHKQYRYVYPALLLVITLAAVGAGEALAWLAARAPVRAEALAAVAIVAWAGASAGRALDYRTNLLDPSDEGSASRWDHARWGLEAMALAREKPGLCGVGLVARHWAWTGGYTWLHRDVPIYPIEDGADRIAADGGFDVAIAPRDLMPLLPEFAVRRCWDDGTCLADRPGGCVAVPAQEVNERIRARGE